MNTLGLAPVAVVLAITGIGCSGSRGISIDGYDRQALDGKRIALVYPAASECLIERPELFAAARGVALVSAPDVLDHELRTMLCPAVDAQLDSNDVIAYDAQPVAQMVPMAVASEFPKGEPAKWEKLSAAAREGNLDFMIALTSITVRSHENQHRGKEGAVIAYVLVDPIRSVVMTRGQLTLPMIDLIDPHETYRRIAEELACRLPFHIAEVNR